MRCPKCGKPGFVSKKPVTRKELAKSLRILRNLFPEDAAFSHDYADHRDLIRQGVREILDSEWAQSLLKEHDNARTV